MADVIKLARELGKAIQEDAAYQQYNAARLKADDDKELQDMIGQFNLKRMDMSQAMSGETEPDQEKLEQLDGELKKLYNTVMAHPAMEDVSDAKNGMDALMQFVNQILTASVNGEDPYLVEKASSCGGGCSSCGGCH